VWQLDVAGDDTAAAAAQATTAGNANGFVGVLHMQKQAASRAKHLECKGVWLQGAGGRAAGTVGL